MRRTSSMAWGALTALLGGLLLYAGEVICPKCAWENDDGRDVCSHCNATLPKPTAPEQAAAPATGGGQPGKPSFLDPAVVESEMAEARRCLPGNSALARRFLLNAQALEMLTDPAQTNSRSAVIEQLTRSCDRGGALIRIKCPTCAGTGQRKFVTSSLSGTETVRDTQGLPCTACHGTGWISRRATIADLKFRDARAQDEYRLAQQARKFVPIGDAWVPQDLETRLKVRQQAQVRRVTAAPCAACAGLGRADCPDCHGEGRQKCRAGGCINGKVKVDRSDERVIRLKETSEEACKVCGGTGLIMCVKCGGRGSLPCAQCGGSGQRAPCAKCSAQGFITCGKCNGAGRTAKGVCEICGGEGLALCPTCRGDGRKR